MSEHHFTIDGEAFLVPDDIETASRWASEHIEYHPGLRWIISRIVESDAPNRNGDLWTLADLQENHSTFKHMPMNVLHQRDVVIGFWKASDIVYPTMAGSGPYVEVLGAVWTHGRDSLVEKLDSTFASGGLSTSLECVAERLECYGTPSACGEVFEYQGPTHSSYCDHINQGKSFRKMHNTTFIGGAVLFNGTQPGNPLAKVSDVDARRELDLVAANSASDWQKRMWELQMQRFERTL